MTYKGWYAIKRRNQTKPNEVKRIPPGSRFELWLVISILVILTVQSGREMSYTVVKYLHHALSGFIHMRVKYLHAFTLRFRIIIAWYSSRFDMLTLILTFPQPKFFSSSFMKGYNALWLRWWFWHLIPLEGWYAIKQRNWNQWFPRFVFFICRNFWITIFLLLMKFYVIKYIKKWLILC